ncbi:uncharacterized protein BJ212DRAFT_1479421 [Suillus subaureus]|uniref:Uncharacterized protein n=1 Tax=Suillus subaureus TaxID=48587 RepID=A0A9P7JFH5_9AGAM|nr:uncharacterized protein BJ212DRAFT_1479421 [Suillus subaureus]KAG1819318.1 hypothetical protein BJ212DRAFT_1479421 [Suillus subaureus]
MVVTGSGMEGQAPWMKGKKKEKETAASTVAPPPPPKLVAAAPPPSLLHSQPVDTAILFCIVAAGFNTILDSGTTTTLVQDHSYFWLYSMADAVTVCTANHSSLSTSGHGDCVAILTIGSN